MKKWHSFWDWKVYTTLTEPVQYLPHFILDVRSSHGRVANGEAYEDSPEVESQYGLQLPSQASRQKWEHGRSGSVEILYTSNK